MRLRPRFRPRARWRGTYSGCVVLFTGWFHPCIRLEHSNASLMHRWNQPVNKTTHAVLSLARFKGEAIDGVREGRVEREKKREREKWGIERERSEEKGGGRWKARHWTLTLLAKIYAGALHVTNRLTLACDIFLRISWTLRVLFVI